MARRKTKKQQEAERRRLLALFCSVAAICLGYLLVDAVGRVTGSPVVPPVEQVLARLEGMFLPEGAAPLPAPTGGTVRVTAIDVGQGDCTLIQADGQNVLIDAGENDQGEVVVEALRRRGVDHLDYVIGTHPHSDHIGGMDVVLQAIGADEVILPLVPEKQTPTTKTYLDLLMVIDEKELTLTAAEPGRRIQLQGGAVLTLLGPPAGIEYKDLNNYSVVTRLDYGARSFLFNGDCSKEEEADLLLHGADVDVDVLFVGHHGSRTSTSAKYLQTVSPLAARISCGSSNDYGHPHAETMERLEPLCPIYRTDLLGDVAFTTDGSALSVQWADGGETLI